MGKLRKKYNWRSRQVVDTISDNAETNKIGLDGLDVKADRYDESNALVLPSKKRKVTKVKEDATVVRLLSNKQRKKLEKVVALKTRKLNRVEILADLQKVQASEEQLRLMTSVTEMQTKGLKRCFVEPRTISASDSNSLRGMRPIIKRRKSNAPNVVGFSQSALEFSDSGDSSEECASTASAPAEIKDPSDESAERTKEEERTEGIFRRCAVHCPVTRDAQIQCARLSLPILREEQQIVETVSDHSVVVLCGETGSGKTTQVPQFLYEAGYASEGKQIGVTEPRRIAAVAMSKRVGLEMNSLDTVSYQIRYEGNATQRTKIKFMTDGVLLKEIQKDFLLSRYSVVIVDEAHERSMYSDILIGLLSRIVPLRSKNGDPLKLVIMSATLRIEDFTQNELLFKIPPPVINIESRQYPVTVHFNKRTPTEDYVLEAYKKVCKIHQKLPEGGILVFVTGVQEVNTLCKKLANSFPQPQTTNCSKPSDATEGDDRVQFTKKFKKGKLDFILPQINLDDYAIDPIDREQMSEENAETGRDDDPCDEPVGVTMSDPLHLLPLYSMLPPERQAKIFETPPEGSRLCVVATNVAETSLTLPNIRYVVDTGKVKTRMYDRVTGVSAYVVTWTSKASASQRAGRAGRTAPGHCYRLYSSSVFVDQFPNFSVPEIARRPIDDLVLQMKSMGIDKVVNFPFPTPPSEESLKAAEKRLKLLGALEDKSLATKTKNKLRNEWNSKITELGRSMACFAISPRYGKMLALSRQHGLLPYVVAIVSALTVQEVFLADSSEQPETKQNKWKEIKKTWAGQGNSLLLGDVMVLLKAVGASEFNGCTPKFCHVHGLRPKALREIKKLRIQLTNEVNVAMPGIDLCVDPKMAPPGDVESKLLRQLVLTGTVDRVARKVPRAEISEDKKGNKDAYRCLELDDFVFIHPQSVLHRKNCQFIVYQEIVETSKLYMRKSCVNPDLVVTAVEPQWLALYCPSQCTFSKPVDEPRYDPDSDTVLCHVNATFGRWAWDLPVVEREFPEGLDKYRWFAHYLLCGDVFPLLKKYEKVLLSPSATVTKSWFKLHRPSEQLLLALAQHGISSKHQLSHRWNNIDSNYLLREYRLWLPEVLHSEIGQKWPPKDPNSL